MPIVVDVVADVDVDVVCYYCYLSSIFSTNGTEISLARIKKKLGTSAKISISTAAACC